MKMTYLRPHNHARKKRNRVLAASIGVAVIAIVLVQFLAPHIFPTFFTAIATPFWRGEFAVNAGAFRSPSEILAENESLHTEIADLRMNYASSSVALLQAQYNDLLAMFGRASTTPKQFVLGAVLARPTFVPYDELIIDVGLSDGVASTSKVYSAEKVLIGYIREVLAHSAKVALYSSPGEVYSVLIGPKHVSATAAGKGGGQYRAEVPHGSDVKVGDFVSDSAIDDRAFGVVVSILTDPSNPFDTVLFAPPVNIYEIRFVFVDTIKPATSRR